eukprot:5995021-Pleurochrysis_carterae.AAC.2
MRERDEVQIVRIGKQASACFQSHHLHRTSELKNGRFPVRQLLRAKRCVQMEPYKVTPVKVCAHGRETDWREKVCGKHVPGHVCRCTE